MKTLLSVAVVLLAVPGSRTAPLPRPPAPDRNALFLSVATPAVHGARAIQAGGSVPVVLTNVTDKPVHLWRDWCSWGYYNISLDFQAGGKEWKAVKRPRGWTKNYPDAMELAPGESAIFTQQLTEEIWDGLPPFKTMGGEKIKMRVRYEVAADEDTFDKNVWTGTLVTAFREYTILR